MRGSSCLNSSIESKGIKVLLIVHNCKLGTTVTVVVTEINSKRIYLVGEVLHSGAAPMLPNMTVLQALSSAGISQFANTKRIYVLRTENGKQQKLPVNYRKLVKGEQIEQNYLLQPGDTIVVP